MHKKGSQRDPKNYRETAVLCTTGRIYFKVPRNILEKEIDTKQAKEQSSFRARKSTTNNIFTLKTVTEK
jgi:hypothetical protein